MELSPLAPGQHRFVKPGRRHQSCKWEGSNWSGRIWVCQGLQKRIYDIHAYVYIYILYWYIYISYIYIQYIYIYNMFTFATGGWPYPFPGNHLDPCTVHAIWKWSSSNFFQCVPRLHAAAPGDATKSGMLGIQEVPKFKSCSLRSQPIHSPNSVATLKGFLR